MSPACPRRGAAHATRVRSSAGRVRAPARPRPPGRAAPSGDPRSPSRVPPGGPAAPLPFPRSRPGRPSAGPLPKVTAARGSPGGGPEAGLRPPPQLAQLAALHRLLRGTCGECGASGGQRGGTGQDPRAPGPAPPGTCAALRGELAGAACQRVHPAGTAPRPRRPRRVLPAPLSGAFNGPGRAGPPRQHRHAPALKGTVRERGTRPRERPLGGCVGLARDRAGEHVGGVRGHMRHTPAV